MEMYVVENVKDSRFFTKSKTKRAEQKPCYFKCEYF